MNLFNNWDVYFMKKAISQALISYDNGDVPVGAVIVKDNEIISYGRNRKEEKRNALLHAEIEALNKAIKILGDWRLKGCKMYVTCEPCIMCVGALLHCRLDEIVFGVNEPKFGGVISNARLFDIPYNHKIRYKYGLLADEIKNIMQQFFKELRK
ncbi:nucleoside deaminase [Deferribacter autotrophicus]|uniref:tRNA-specific adenosine deaminase n=1 Tax=Deferribacter autotrophicus TaxID=500465 RepID=A0A5A8F942_9BACT|nr:nucleoside deaminase [Deferribacter autotrophicus]KAA0259442.1 nucleoside deaminase [Deferribacter autotrophicus]